MFIHRGSPHMALVIADTTAVHTLSTLAGWHGYLPNFAILFLFSKSSFWYGFYLKNENEKFLFYLKYKENMCGSWFASQFTPPIPPPTNQPNAEIWHINVSVPKTKRWIIQIKNFHFCYQKNKTKHNSIFSKCKKVNQLMHFIFTKSTK